MQPAQHVHAVVLCLIAFVAPAPAEDSYYQVRLSELKVTGQPIPPSFQSDQPWRVQYLVAPYAALDQGGEAYIAPDQAGDPLSGTRRSDNVSLIVCTAHPGDVTGRLYLPVQGEPNMRVIHFTVPASVADPKARDRFDAARRQHYESLLSENMPGTAWFRHQANESEQRADARGSLANRNRRPAFDRMGRDRFDDSYDLFSGGRALSENLQLDRFIPDPRGGTNETVQTASLKGLTTAAYDFESKVAGKQIALDPLSQTIPADQHALFFPTFEAMIRAMDEVDAHGSLVVGLAEPRSEDQRVFERYQRQLCLPVSDLARKLGPALVAGIAVTGSDPYLPTGSDIAILFEPKVPGAIEAFIGARQALAAQQAAGAQPVKGDIDGTAYHGVVTPDRSISSYIATVGNVAVVANSLAQLRQLVATRQGKQPALAASADYKFFRDRYPRGEANETAFLVLSDATIRRWCGPRWRIGAARRIHAAAVISDMQAGVADAFVRGTVVSGPIPSPFQLPGGGDWRLTKAGVASSVYGTLDFLTPIIELDLDRVTRGEADLYDRWREGYAMNWSRFFDPIAVRFTLHGERLSADVSVLPLIAGSEYNEFINVTREAKIEPAAGDRHSDTLMHFILAINTRARPMQELIGTARSMVPALDANPLGWLGSSIAVYADNDPIWEEAAKDPRRSDSLHFLEENFSRIPVAVRFEVSNGLKLAAFLAAIRGYIEQSSPGLTVWETLTYKEQPYVKIGPSARSAADDPNLKNFGLYYCASAKSLLVTPSEALLKRALDRQEQRRGEAAGKDGAAAEIVAPWPGESVALHVDHAFVPIAAMFMRAGYETAMQTQAWSNIPILNEWKRRFPNRDPVDVHQSLWGVRLICPGGGTYQWNEEYQTMESTVYGHPGQPKHGPVMPPSLTRFASGDFGLTFEENGLRAKVVLDLKKAAP